MFASQRKKIDYASKNILGIHHITAITANLGENINFYASILGLRLIKITVNFDDPKSYHLYYGNEVGYPGTILTFFVLSELPRGRRGCEQVTSISFSIPANSIGFWTERLGRLGLISNPPEHRFDEEYITLFDPDGLQLELVAHSNNDIRAAWHGVVPEEHAIQGFYNATLSEREFDPTSMMLGDILGMKIIETHDSCVRYQMGDGGPGALIDLETDPKDRRGFIAAGNVHHIALRTLDSDSQRVWRTTIAQEGINVTPVRDRKYFQSIYFREPGGILFEIATDGPGFAVDETLEELGKKLMLPSWLEPSRLKIEQSLPPINLERVGQKI